MRGLFDGDDVFPLLPYLKCSAAGALTRPSFSSEGEGLMESINKSECESHGQESRHFLYICISTRLYSRTC